MGIRELQGVWAAIGPPGHVQGGDPVVLVKSSCLISGGRGHRRSHRRTRLGGSIMIAESREDRAHTCRVTGIASTASHGGGSFAAQHQPMARERQPRQRIWRSRPVDTTCDAKSRLTAGCTGGSCVSMAQPCCLDWPHDRRLCGCSSVRRAGHAHRDDTSLVVRWARGVHAGWMAPTAYRMLVRPRARGTWRRATCASSVRQVKT
jgi:hypothetical protein